MRRESYLRRVIGLSALSVVLAALYIAGGLTGPNARAERRAERALLEGFQQSAVSELRLRSPDTVRPVELARQGTGWFVVVRDRRFPASPPRVGSLLTSLAELRSGKIMSSNPARLSSFGLYGESAGQIQAIGAGGAVIAAIEIGKRGPSGNEDYLRVAGRKEIHLTRSSLSFYVGQDRRYWYDLAVLPYEVSGPRISEISIAGAIPLDSTGRAFSRESYRLVRNAKGAGDWSVATGGPRLDQVKVDSLANALATLQGVDFLVDSAPPPTVGTELRVGVTIMSGHHYSFVARPIRAANGEELYLIRRDGAEEVYVVNSIALRRAVMPLESLGSTE